jgi:mRNA interferase HigB
VGQHGGSLGYYSDPYPTHYGSLAFRLPDADTALLTGTLRLIPLWEQRIINDMRIIARGTLRAFWEQHPDAEQAWYHNAKRAAWTSPADIKNVYATASIVGNNRVVFNIRGNHYRLVVAINYGYGIVYIRFIGTHQEYDKIDATTI